MALTATDEVKISGLPDNDPLTGVEEVPAVQDGDTIRFTLNELKTWLAIPKTPYSTTFGNGSSADFTITHNLGTRAVHVTVFRTASPYDEITVGVEHTTVNQIRIFGFGSSPTLNEYTVVVSV